MTKPWFISLWPKMTREQTLMAQKTECHNRTSAGTGEARCVLLFTHSHHHTHPYPLTNMCSLTERQRSARHHSSESPWRARGVGQGWWPPWLLGDPDREMLRLSGETGGRSHVCLGPAKARAGWQVVEVVRCWGSGWGWDQERLKASFWILLNEPARSLDPKSHFLYFIFG